MATFSTNFYNAGRDSAVKFPELDALEKSQQRAGELAIKGEEVKLNKVLSDKATFLKMMATDPVATISDINMKRQALALEEYNNTFGKKYVESKGNLSFADELAMASAKRGLQTFQQKLLTEQEQFQKAYDVIQRDTRGYYDQEHFVSKMQEYYKSGELPRDLLRAAPQDIRPLLSKDPNQSAYAEPTRLPVTDKNTGNIVGYQNGSNEYKRNKEEARRAIFDKLQYEPVLRSVIQDFQSQPESVQYEALKDYDRNGDIKLDPEERTFAYAHMNKMDNPIIKWAMNNPDYITASMGANPATPKNIAGSSSSNSVAKNASQFAHGAGTWKYEPREARNIEIGGKRFTQYHEYQNMPALSISLTSKNGIDVLSSGMTSTVEVPMQLSAIPYGYDESSDKYVFLVNKDFENIGISGVEAGGGIQIAIPRSSLDQGFFSKTLEVMKNGQKVKVGQLKREEPKEKPKVKIGL